MDMSGMNIKALADMLRVPDEDSDSEDDKPKSSMSAMGPGDVGPAKKTATNSIVEKTKPESADIWDADEVHEGQEYEDIHDPRLQPDYDIVYKQAVRSEDMFLGMGNKNPSTASCEEMIVKINLPDTSYADVKLDVKDRFLDCRSPKFKLGLHLPHPVDPQKGRAQWNSDLSQLSVTLTMKRDLDFINL